MPARLDARLCRLEAQTTTSAWLHGEGLASLLAHAQRHPAEAVDLEDILDAETPPRGLARCLWELRHTQHEEPPA